MSAIFAGLPPRYLPHPRGVPLRRSVNPHVGEAPHLRDRPRYSKLGAASCIGSKTFRPGSIPAPRRRPPTRRRNSAAGEAPPCDRRRPRPARSVAEPIPSCQRAHRTRSEREQLELFRALRAISRPAMRILCLLSASPKPTGRRDRLRMNGIAIPPRRGSSRARHATIWDADVLIWRRARCRSAATLGCALAPEAPHRTNS